FRLCPGAPSQTDTAGYSGKTHQMSAVLPKGTCRELRMPGRYGKLGIRQREIRYRFFSPRSSSLGHHINLLGTPVCRLSMMNCSGTRFYADATNPYTGTTNHTRLQFPRPNNISRPYSQ